MANNLSGSTVAELYALLGIDTSQLDSGLAKSKLKMAETARDMVVSVKTIADVYTQLPGAIVPVIQEYARLSRSAQEANQDIIAGIQLLEEQKLAVLAVTAAQRAQYEESQALADIRLRLATEIVREDAQVAAHFKQEQGERIRASELAAEAEVKANATANRLKAAQDRQYIQLWKSLLRERDTQEAEALRLQKARLAETLEISAIRGRLDQYGTLPTGEREAGIGLAGNIARRAALYAGIYGAGRLVSSALNRPIDIQRVSEQANISTEEAQRLDFAAAATGTPVETVASSIARLQERIQEMAPKTREMLESLKIPVEEFVALMATDTTAAVRQAVMAIERADDVVKAGAWQELFGGRAGRSNAALVAWASNLQQGVILTNRQVEAVRELSSWWAVTSKNVEAYVALLASRAVPSGGRIADLSVPGILGDAGAQLGEILASSVAGRLKSYFSGPQPSEMPLGGWIQPPETGGEIKYDQGNEEGRKALQDFIKLADQASVDAQRYMAEITGVLKSFGVEGSRNLAAVEGRMNLLAQAYQRGEITLNELRQAQFGFYQEMNAGLPTLQEAMRLFEQGLITETALYQARAAAQRSAALAEAERAFAAGKIGADQLREQFEISQPKQKWQVPGPGGRMIDTPWDFRPGTPPAYPGMIPPSGPPSPPNPKGNWEEIMRDRMRQNKTREEVGPQGSLGGSINLVALDQFSEQMVRRWKQQGLLTT